MSENLETLRGYKEILERSLVQEHQELEYVMSGKSLIETREELGRLYEEHRTVSASSSFNESGRVITEESSVRQKLSILHYQICDYEDSFELITSGHRAQEHLQCISEMDAELADIKEKIKRLEQESSG